MKRCILLSVLCFLAAVLLPLAVLQEKSQPAIPEPPPLPENSEAATLRDEDIQFSFLDNGTVRTVTMAEYLPGVLAGEMPAAFHREALRAQAVAARTYALYKIQQTTASHAGAPLCSDPGCCQQWLEEPALRERWGPDYDYYMERIASAVTGTSGQYLTYEEEPILACFHSSSPGLTQSSAAVWGRELPYLVTVSSPETAGDVPNYVTTVEISPEEFRTLAEAALTDTAFSDLPGEWLGERITDSTGRVASMRLGGISVPGTTIRDIYGLRSACFELSWTGRSFLFTVTGYGHGAGMSQYGANVMAKDGRSYGEILAHYYPGTTLVGATDN